VNLNYLSKFKTMLKKIAGLNEDTKKLSLSLSVGIAIGLSPFYGLHTLMSIAFGFLFKLNKVAVLASPWIVNPFTIVPIYGSGTAFGALILGYHKTHLKDLNFGDSFIDLERLGVPFFKSFIVGNLIFSVVGGLLSYWIFFFIIKKLRRDIKETTI
jgi:uncharacterized protein